MVNSSADVRVPKLAPLGNAPLSDLRDLIGAQAELAGAATGIADGQDGEGMALSAGAGGGGPDKFRIKI